jgi:Holliday junction resolvasome RuvABC DNA-binding subunit
MTYKVKGNASAPTTHEANESPDADVSKENTEGQQYEAYNQEGYQEDEPEDEAETLRRKNSEEESELLKAAVQQREKEDKLKK